MSEVMHPATGNPQPSTAPGTIHALTYRENGKVWLQSVLPVTRDEDPDAPARSFFRLKDGSEFTLDRSQIVSLDLETLIVDMGEVILTTARDATGGINRLLSRKPDLRLRGQELESVAIAISQLYLYLLEFRFGLEFPSDIARALAAHQRTVIPELLLAYRPEMEELSSDEPREFIQRYEDGYAELSASLAGYQQNLRPAGDRTPDLFWYFLRNKPGCVKVTRGPMKDMVAVLRDGIGELELDGFLTELRQPTPVREASGRDEEAA